MRIGGSSFRPSEIQAAWGEEATMDQVVRDDAAQRLSLELELERMHLALAVSCPSAPG